MRIWGNWGLWIAVIYGLFVLWLIVFLIFTLNHKVELVAADYYDKDLAYQQQIDKINRSALLEDDLIVIYSNKNINLEFPRITDYQEIFGTMTLFRPSSASMDSEIALKPDSQYRQLVDASMFAKGLWIVKIDWAAGDSTYYYEEEFIFE